MGQRHQVGVSNLSVTYERRKVGVGNRDVIGEEAVAGESTSDMRTLRAVSTPIGLGRTFGLDETRTKPLSVTGQVAQPRSPCATNHARIWAWWTWESHASATRALTSSRPTDAVNLRRARVEPSRA